MELKHVNITKSSLEYSFVAPENSLIYLAGLYMFFYEVFD